LCTTKSTTRTTAIDSWALLNFWNVCKSWKHNGTNVMRNQHVLSATRRWHRSYRTLHFLRLFSVTGL
jgi:hypothetical protein